VFNGVNTFSRGGGCNRAPCSLFSFASLSFAYLSIASYFFSFRFSFIRLPVCFSFFLLCFPFHRVRRLCTSTRVACTAVLLFALRPRAHAAQTSICSACVRAVEGTFPLRALHAYAVTPGQLVDFYLFCVRSRCRSIPLRSFR
jgi:hypothetical protein